jgi:hypothetical protein
MMLDALTNDPAMVLLGLLCLAVLGLLCLLVQRAKPRLGRSALIRWLTGADIPEPRPLTPAPPPASAPTPQTTPSPQSAAPAVPDDNLLPGIAERRRVLEQAEKSVADGTALIKRLERWEHGAPAPELEPSRSALEKEPDGQGHKN